MYDSTEDTEKHIARVRELLSVIVTRLTMRGVFHDSSKLLSPEKEVFDKMTPLLRGSTYGSEEYKKFLGEMKPALDHHYSENSHHPEFFKNGVEGMDLFDLIEMLCDWKAATERHANGDLRKSLEINKGRFNIGEQLEAVLRNTAISLGWVEKEPQ